MLTFLEGLLSFVSPCVLPLLPVYLIYFAGDESREDSSPRRVLFNAIAFSCGFSLVFILLGVFAGTLGSLLAAHRRTVNLACGAAIVVFGLSFWGVVRLPFKGFAASGHKIAGIGSAVVFGVVFALGMTPCVGAFLGAALMTAASEGGALKGAWLLAEYSLGLAIPFVLSAIMMERLKNMFAYFKEHSRAVSFVSGGLLIALGVCMAFGCSLGTSTAKVVDENPVKEEQEMEITLNAANFEAEVLKSEKPVIVDFWATWCGPCRMLAPELEQLAVEKAGAIKVGKVNVDENPELCAKYGIASIPAIFVFKNGQITAQSVGYQRKADLAALLEK